MITNETGRLCKLIEDLLSVSQVDAGAARLSRVAVRVDEVVRQAVQDMQGLADAKSLELTVDVPSMVRAIPGTPCACTRWRST